MRVNRRKWHCLKPVSSGLMVLFGIALFSIHGNLVDMTFDQVFVFTPNNYFFREFKDPKVPIRINVYYFNWTNPEDLMNRSVKPRFEEIGPLVYHEKVHRCNITFHDNDTISYRNEKTFYFQEDESSHSLEDNITTLNVIPLIASDKSRNWNFFLRKGLSIALYDSPYHLTKTAGEWLFAGFEDTLMKTASYLPFMDDLPDMDKFAWFYKRNKSASYEGTFNIGTGMGNTTIGKTYTWNYRNRTDLDGQCSEMQANAEIYPQNMGKDNLELFSSDFCRKIILEYNGSTIWNGIEAYRFTAGVHFLDNGKHYSQYTCMCNRKCPRYGVTDYSRCKFGIPAYLSLPHFIQADPSYRNDIEGMKPDSDKHKFEMLVNPRSGLILKMDMGIQMNLLLEPNPSISKYQNVPEVMFPVFWFNLNTHLTNTQIILLNFMLRLKLILQIISLVLMILGTVLHVRFLYEFFSGKAKKEEKNKPNNNFYDTENLSLMMHKDLYDKT